VDPPVEEDELAPVLEAAPVDDACEVDEVALELPADEEPRELEMLAAVLE
jgi:hypothetical protein